ncbi:MAG: DNA polymerase II large subunit, partial [Candidatus ainarchaeum sp.]|nr:DNA polymerase II large subunit [Candidatus ainarchaeum sp.]
GTSYVGVYFTGPIRSAGGTVAALAVLLADYARKVAKIGDYRATEAEIERYAEEVNVYEARASHLQYKPSDDDVKWIAKNCPVCIDGDPTEDVEVSVYRDLPRVETNRVRGGMPLVVCEGIAQKAMKVYKYSKKFGLGWDWLEKLIKVTRKESTTEIKPDWTYLEGLVAGRPVFAYPSTKGGFRLRYGKSRTNGLMAKNIHPATMVLLDGFTAVGTHNKIERPGKGAIMSGCGSIEPPIVKLKDGSVVKVKDIQQADALKGKVEMILFLGDMLVNYGDFLKSGHPLMPSGWCEEWWTEECKAKNVKPERFQSAREAFEFSKNCAVPLHPDYVYFWHDVDAKGLRALAHWLAKGDARFDSGELRMLTLPPGEEKLILEELGVEHKVAEGKIYLDEDHAYGLMATLGLAIGQDGKISLERFESLYSEDKKALALACELSGIEIKAKSPTYIGARMGRPEKAKERAMEGNVHVLFPTGSPKNRSITKMHRVLRAREEKSVYAEAARFICPSCKNITPYRRCELCGTRTIGQNTCPSCGAHTTKTEHCVPTVPYDNRPIAIASILEIVRKQFGTLPDEIKGVRGLSSARKIPERLEKGFFRAKHGIFVFRDGTSRFDATDIPLTHFKPAEIMVSVEKLRELGYTKDYLGNELESEEQIVPLRPQDILVSEYGAEYFIRAAKYMDDMLVGLYNMKPFYNVQKKEDLIGQLFIGLSPHTSSGVLVRLIGFTKANVGFGHPYFHAAKRRNADGDEDAIMLLLDALLNFSRRYLSESRGGTMDAPITISTIIDPKEVDDEAHNMEMVFSYPLELYRAAERFAAPGEVKMKTVKDVLGTPEQYGQMGLTHDTIRIDEGPLRTAYVSLKSIPDKIDLEFALEKRLRAVDVKDICERLILSHFIPDLYGNLHSFSRQTFRCSDCNEIFRRVPLSGKCTKCGGKLLLTINKGGIEKYLEISRKLAQEYDLPAYMKQRLDLIDKEIHSIFEDEKIKQMGISDFM